MSSAHLAVTLGMAISLSPTFPTVPAPVVEPISPILVLILRMSCLKGKGDSEIGLVLIWIKS